MNGRNRRKVWRLAGRETLRLDDARGTMLQVARGVLWITLENDTRDIVLGDGDTFTIDRNGVSLAEAQGPTTVHVHSRDAFGGKSLAAQLAGRVARWLSRVGAAIPPRRWAPYV